MTSDFRKFFAVFVCTVFVLLLPPASPAKASPEAFVVSLSRQILAAARTQNSGMFHALLRSHADIHGIADFALGRFRGKLPANQRSTYYRLAEQNMVKFFRNYSGSLKGSSVTVKRVSRNGNVILVESSIDGGGGNVSWRLIQHGGYKVRDVQVAGIWLGHLMRSEYGSILRREGYKSLFAYLQK